MSLATASSRLRLRLGFLSFGVVLLAGLAALAMMVSERLREARRDREEMVALRVFDELEREASVFLDEESGRSAYQSLRETNPESWAPFVVGYFRRLNGRTEMVAADGATTENRRRLAWALQQVGPSLSVVDLTEQKLLRARQPDVDQRPEAPAPVPSAIPGVPSPGAHVTPKTRSSGSSIIQSLNRAQERRKLQKKPSVKAPAPEKEDQFQDYSELF